MSVKAKSQSPRVNRGPLVALRVAYLLALAVLSLGAVLLVSGRVGVGGPYLDMLLWSYLPAYLLVAPALVQLVRGRSVSSTLHIVSKALAVIVILMLVWLAFGAVQNLLGLPCRGFFNALTSCVDLQYILLFIWIFNPYVLLSLIGLTFLAAAKGWFDYFYYNDRK